MPNLFLHNLAAGFSDLAIEAAGCCQALDGAYVCPSGSMNFTIDILSFCIQCFQGGMSGSVGFMGPAASLITSTSSSSSSSTSSSSSSFWHKGECEGAGDGECEGVSEDEGGGEDEGEGEDE